MIVTKEIFEAKKKEILNAVDRIMMQESSLTYGRRSKGQLVYDITYHFLEDLHPAVETLGDSRVDCFYNDNKINIFIDSIEEEMVGHNYVRY